MEIHDNDFSRARAIVVAIVASMLVLSGCDSVSQSGNAIPEGNDGWLIPRSEVVDGGPGKDGIASLDAPTFAPARATEYIQDDRLIVGVRVGNEVRAYPHQVLDWHEIVNDVIDGKPVALTYCPLTGTGMAWDAEVDGVATEFGVSGLLFKNNLVPYDRATDSNWSQMQLRAVWGERSGIPVRTIQVVETTWATWREMYPESDVLTRETGFPLLYLGFAYGRSYLTDENNILFPVRNPSERLPNKERVHGIISEQYVGADVPPRVYVINRFGPGVNVIEDEHGETEYVVAGSSDLNFAVAFKRELPGGTRLSFTPVQDALPVIMRDEEGNSWDIFGTAVAGPRAGERLVAARAFTGYWFAWADFYPDVTIYGE